MSRIAVVSVCQLHQQSLDFEGNLMRIEQSIDICMKRNSVLRIGPELEISGYSCDDHFFEENTVVHSYEIAARILSNKRFHNIVIDLGLPVIHKGLRYNCRMICLNGQILLIRPKKVLANDGCYSEWRWFACWQKEVLDEWVVHPCLFKTTGQRTVPFGIAVLQFNDTVLGHETCEELFIPDSVHQTMVLNGAEIVCNSSGSHFVVGKLKARLELARGASKKGGCLYLYSNLIGCDAGRMYFDGGSFIHHRGVPVKMLSQHKLPVFGVEVGTSAIELEEIRSDRASRVSWMNSATRVKRIPKIYVSFDFCNKDVLVSPYTISDDYLKYSLSDDLIKGPACWLWSFSTRCHFNGFLLPLSGGMDSTSVGVIVYGLCCMLYQQITQDTSQDYPNLTSESVELLDQLRSVLNSGFVPKSPKDIVRKLLTTVYLSNPSISSEDSQKRAREFAQEIGSHHLEIPITSLVDTTLSTISKSLNLPPPRFSCHNGSVDENISLQNIQARSRMMLMRVLKNKVSTLSNKKMLILGTGNADEAIRGYLTKYDCSAADINPIGSLGKEQISQILQYAQTQYNLKSTAAVLSAKPSAELVPSSELSCVLGKDGVQELQNSHVQSDEDEMGMTYKTLSLLRHIRKSELCGPRATFRKLASLYLGSDPIVTSEYMSIEDLALLVKRFFSFYARNRHKTSSLPPSVHMHDNSVDDNRYDMRPLLYTGGWCWQFTKIDEIVQSLSNSQI